MNFKFTKNRQSILSLLQKSPDALSAAAVHTKLPAIDLVTIYRNLDLFTKEKLIKQFYLHSGEAVYEYQAKPHHHAVCTECERVVHFVAPDEQIKQLLRLENFTVDEIEVTVRGTCNHTKKTSGHSVRL